MLILKINPKRIARKKVEIASELLREGKLVAFPTETVYGLGASAFNREAMRRVYEVKGRERGKALTVHIARKEDVEIFAKEIPPLAEKLISNFWPGPLTMILPKKEDVPEEISSSEKVGLRMPSHPISLALIERSGPLVAPSANLSGYPSPTSAQMVVEQLGDKVDCVIDGGKTILGIESTVIDITAKPVILREGMITREEIERVIDEEVEEKEVLEEKYFPARVIVVEGKGDGEIAEAIKKLVEGKEGAGIIATRGVCQLLPREWKKASWGRREDVLGMAQRFFSLLDGMKDARFLVVESPPPEGIGKVLRSKLMRIADEVVKIN
ncbi:MAG: L-threonylcarbamoyladenylate synthase [bacterium]